MAKDWIGHVCSGTHPLVWRYPGGDWSLDAPRDLHGILSGSFNPRHAGHVKLRQSAEATLQPPQQVAYELTIWNADKPPLAQADVERRLDQFDDRPVALTRAATFVEKSRIMPGTVFVVGFDTAERIVDPRFYDGSVQRMVAALTEIDRHGCRFLVAGRLQAATFRTLRDLSVGADWTELFDHLADFRVDLSSTELRRTPRSE